MRYSNKLLLVLVMVLSLLGLSPADGSSKPADKYPSKPIKLHVGRAAGGSTDLVARLLQPFLTKELRQTVIIENVPTGGGKIVTNRVFKAAPDGYSLLAGNFPTEVLNQAVDDNLPYDMTKFTPIYSYSGGTAPAINTLKNSPIKTLDDLIKAGKQKKLIMSTMTGLANSPVAYALFAKHTGVKFEVIPYASGAEALTALLGGHSQVSFNNAIDIMEKDGKEVNTLAIFLPERHRDLPNVPTFSEKYPGVVLETHVGLLAPPNTPKEVVNVLAAAMDKICKDPAFVKAAAKIFDVKPLGPEAFGKKIQAELDSARQIKDIMMQFVGKDQAGGKK